MMSEKQARWSVNVDMMTTDLNDTALLLGVWHSECLWSSVILCLELKHNLTMWFFKKTDST